jgi:hypothetical protein
MASWQPLHFARPLLAYSTSHMMSEYAGGVSPKKREAYSSRLPFTENLLPNFPTPPRLGEERSSNSRQCARRARAAAAPTLSPCAASTVRKKCGQTAPPVFSGRQRVCRHMSVMSQGGGRRTERVVSGHSVSFLVPRFPSKSGLIPKHIVKHIG